MPLTPYLLLASFVLLAAIFFAVYAKYQDGHNVTVLEIVIALALAFIPFVQFIVAFVAVVAILGISVTSIYNKWEDFFNFEIRDIPKLWRKEEDEDTTP